jgi:uncharacterized protein
MADDLIRYDVLAQDALRGMVRKVLAEVAQTGLPGEHHFFITFNTRHPGVRISSRLRAQYPDEMTIVLQHQFWDLNVTETTFEVGLSFNGVPERLLIPFRAGSAFIDPHASFGLRFDAQTETEKGTAALPAAKDAPAPLPPASPPEPAPPQAATDASGAEVVSLDAFRKKGS